MGLGLGGGRHRSSLRPSQSPRPAILLEAAPQTHHVSAPAFPRGTLSNPGPLTLSRSLQPDAPDTLTLAGNPVLASQRHLLLNSRRQTTPYTLRDIHVHEDTIVFFRNIFAVDAQRYPQDG